MYELLYYGYLGSLAVILKRQGFRNVEPAMAFLYAWLVPAPMVLSQIVIYHTFFTPDTFVIAIVFNSAFLLGCAVFRDPALLSGWSTLGQIVEDPPGYIYLLLVGMTVIYSAIVLTGFFQLLSHGFNLQEIRQERWADLYAGKSQQSLFGILKAACRAPAIFFSILTPIWIKKGRILPIVLAGLTFFALLSESLQEGGRAMAVYIIVLMFYATLVHREYFTGSKLNLNSPLFVAIILVGVVTFATFVYLVFVAFPLARGTDILYYLKTGLEAQNRAHMADWVATYYANPSTRWVVALALSSTYFTVPINKLSLYYNIAHVQDWYLLGAFNFPQLARVLQIGTHHVDPWAEAMVRLSHIGAEGKYAQAPWSTYIRDFMMDFGIYGGAVFSFVVGGAYQMLFQHGVRMKSSLGIGIAAIAISCCMIMPFLTPLPKGMLTNTLLLLLIVAFFAKRYKLVLFRPRRAPHDETIPLLH